MWHGESYCWVLPSPVSTHQILRLLSAVSVFCFVFIFLKNGKLLCLLYKHQPVGTWSPRLPFLGAFYAAEASLIFCFGHVSVERGPKCRAAFRAFVTHLFNNLKIHKLTRQDVVWTWATDTRGYIYCGKGYLRRTLGRLNTWYWYDERGHSSWLGRGRNEWHRQDRRIMTALAVKLTL